MTQAHTGEPAVIQDPNTAPARSSTASWRTWLLKRGYGVSMLAITGFSVLASLLLTAIILYLTGADGETLLISMGAAALIPMIVAPCASYSMMHLLFELDTVQRELQQIANLDGLTKIFNRRYFMTQFELNAARAARSREPLSILMIDADNFKLVNDRFGHLAGDQVLQEIAAFCGSTLRPYDILARYGGEEFIVLMPNTCQDEACEIAERVRAGAAALRIQLSEQASLSITLSIGVSSLSESSGGFHLLLNSADEALYEAKRGGRNRWAFRQASSLHPAVAKPAPASKLVPAES